eukprot:CAMPEP_0117481334 /NCGR_PEP_ID=MMETSP0784-20121206/12848_1 /TAXON_ID=39447 /ORGANISM="" /LENGTH=462 /DNA_ID=CAMNT_0005275791 /DNA_START=15 /DNA_END=1400 /DNA_ORIENTATION=-
MIPRVIRAGEEDIHGSGAMAAEDLDERTRRQLFAILQYLQSHDLLEAACALESESGVHYEEGALPEAGVLEASLDMFANYRAEAGRGASDVGRSVEEELVQVERGVCCTSGLGEAANKPTLGANVTAVCWVASSCSEMVAVVATADRRLRAMDVEAEVLCELADFSSPILNLDAVPCVDTKEGADVRSPAVDQELLATSMGGETVLLRVCRPTSSGGSWALEVAQRFKDHAKHVTCGRFAPPAEEGGSCTHFVTASRDHQAMLYERRGGEFSLAGTVRSVGEVTSCCWASATTFVLASRDDHHLRYWDVAGSDGKPAERLKTNLNALGDSVVSFTVLALAVSPDRRLIAVCTDKSRIILLPTFSDVQVRNLYGAVIDEYDVPSVSFSMDRSFLYATSSLPQKAVPQRGEVGEVLCGEVVIFEIRTGAVVLKLPCHTKPVRCMDRHPLTEALVTGSFDKTVRF